MILMRHVAHVGLSGSLSDSEAVREYTRTENNVVYAVAMYNTLHTQEQQHISSCKKLHPLYVHKLLLHSPRRDTLASHAQLNIYIGTRH